MYSGYAASSTTSAAPPPLYHEWQPGDVQLSIADTTTAQTLRPWEIADGRITTTKRIGGGKFGVVRATFGTLCCAMGRTYKTLCTFTPLLRATI